MKALLAITALLVASVVRADDPPLYRDDHVIVKMKVDDWQEAIGRALYLSAYTDRQPGVMLISGPDDRRLLMAKLACIRGGIKLYTVIVD